MSPHGGVSVPSARPRQDPLLRKSSVAAQHRKCAILHSLAGNANKRKPQVLMSETEPIVKWLSPLSAEWVCPLPRSGSALSRGERVDRDGAFTSRRGPGEGSLARFRQQTSSVPPRSSTAVQSRAGRLFRSAALPQPGFAGETGGEPFPSASGRATRTISRFEPRLGCAARAEGDYR